MWRLPVRRAFCPNADGRVVASTSIGRRKPRASYRLLALASFASVLVLADLALGDWPHLRGPFYDGVSRERLALKNWASDGPPRAWSRDLGQGHSGFILSQGRLFTQFQTSAGQKAVCLDPSTGDTLWERWYDWAWQPKGAYPGPYATPTWYKNRLYCVSPTGVVACLDADTGATVWSLNVKERFAGKGAGFGWAAAPLVENDRLILPVGGADASIVALHASDGRTLWAVGSDPASYCGVFPLDFQGRRCVVGYLENSIVLHDLGTGRLLHRKNLSSGYDEHSAWPIYREPFLLLTAPFRSPATRLELQAGPDETVATRTDWMCRQLANDVVSSVLVGDHVFGFDLKQLQSSVHRPSRGSFRCVDWKTGQVRWSTDQVGHAAVLATTENLFLLNDTGTLIVAKVDADAYSELARWDLFSDETCWTPPTLSHGRLFVRSPSRCVCLNLGTEENIPVSVKSPTGSPSRVWRMDVRGLLGRERDFPNDAFTVEELANWYLASLGVFGLAGFFTFLFWLLGAIQAIRVQVDTVFWWTAFSLGVFAGGVASFFFEQCLLTWPSSLYALFHGVCVLGWRAQRHGSPRGSTWRARSALVGFVLIGYGYFELCKATGMFIAWVFLAGFPMAFPWTVTAVWMAEARRWYAPSLALEFLAFSVYFWAAQALLWWKG